MNHEYYIQTLDGLFAITKFSRKGYDIGPNSVRTRKTWKTENGANDALIRIQQINPTGATILQIKRFPE